MIPDYLESLARELDFDRSLSRCVRQEVEDHLWEAVAAEPSGNVRQAQQRVIANFGDARAIAAQFAVVSLATHTRRAGVAAVLVIAGDLIAMKARVAWEPSAEIWVAIVTMAIEIACAGFLVFHIRSNTQRAASTAALLKT